MWFILLSVNLDFLILRNLKGNTEVLNHIDLDSIGNTEINNEVERDNWCGAQD